MHLPLYVWAVQAGLCEVLYISMLCFMLVAVVKECKMNHFYGLANGHDIVARAYGAGAVSGGCSNLAVAIGLDVASIHLGFGYCLVYTACEVVGASLVAGHLQGLSPHQLRWRGRLGCEVPQRVPGDVHFGFDGGLQWA